MAGENKREFITALEALCRKCDRYEDLVIEYGYVHFDPDTGKEFVPVTGDLPEGKEECLRFHWENQNPKFGVLQSIAGDSNSGIIADAVKALARM